MTQQISEVIYYKTQPYTIHKFYGEPVPPFDPKNHGFQPVALGTDCWSGYYCDYEIEDNYLFLRDLWMGFPVDEARKIIRTGGGPRFEGRTPELYESSFYPHRNCFVYRSVGFPLEYTGGILLTANWTRDVDYYTFPHPFNGLFAFYEVREAIFEKGKLQFFYDRSVEVNEIRMRYRQLKRIAEQDRPKGDEWSNLVRELRGLFKHKYK